MAEMLAEDISIDDRRRVVNAGVRHGRDAEIDEDAGGRRRRCQEHDVDVIATRGGRLVLRRARFSGRDQRPDAFHTDVLDIVEINADDRIAASVVFDLDDIDAAFEELDARYLAGEAAAHAHTWSVIAEAYAAFNRGELSATTPDCVNIDHRLRETIAPATRAPYIRAARDIAPDFSVYIEAVHRLSDLGAVVTHVTHGTSQEGFEAEWRMIQLVTVEGDLINRSEIFDEADIDAALARFDELIGRRHGWKTRRTKWASAIERNSPPATGTPWRRCSPTTFRVTTSTGRAARASDEVGMPKSRTCGRLPTSG